VLQSLPRAAKAWHPAHTLSTYLDTGTKGYSQLTGTLSFGVATSFIAGPGTVSGGIIQSASGDVSGQLIFSQANWAIKGSTEIILGVDGSTSGANASIKEAANFTLTIGDSSTVNNVIVDTNVYNATPARNNQYTLIFSGGGTGAVNILDAAAMTFGVEAGSPYTASWNDTNSSWGSNFVLTEN
jgi:hypothetical protein